MARGLPAVVLVALVALGAACASPTLPLPPPSQIPAVTALDADHVVITAECASVPANAWVSLVNLATVPSEDKGVVVVASTCGGYTAHVYAHDGDTIEITYTGGLVESEPQELVIDLH
jgi:hypothetical protein